LFCYRLLCVTVDSFLKCLYKLESAVSGFECRPMSNTQISKTELCLHVSNRKLMKHVFKMFSFFLNLMKRDLLKIVELIKKS